MHGKAHFKSDLSLGDENQFQYLSSQENEKISQHFLVVFWHLEVTNCFVVTIIL